MDSQASLAGRMLIAMPGIGDPRFARALLYVCSHDEVHAMAIAVNRPVGGLTVPSLLDKLGVASTIEMPPDLVLNGGPVERERGFVLHTDDYRNAESTIPLSPGLGLTATREVLGAMAGPEHPRRSLLALGYAGWGAGQLDREVLENVWLTCDPDETLIFDQEHDAKWTAALAKIGVTPAMLSAEAGRA